MIKTIAKIMSLCWKCYNDDWRVLVTRAATTDLQFTSIKVVMEDTGDVVTDIFA